MPAVALCAVIVLCAMCVSTFGELIVERAVVQNAADAVALAVAVGDQEGARRVAVAHLARIDRQDEAGTVIRVRVCRGRVCASATAAVSH